MTAKPTEAERKYLEAAAEMEVLNVQTIGTSAFAITQPGLRRIGNSCCRHGWIKKWTRRGYRLTPAGRAVLEAGE